MRAQGCVTRRFLLPESYATRLVAACHATKPDVCHSTYEVDAVLQRGTGNSWKKLSLDSISLSIPRDCYRFYAKMVLRSLG